MTDPKPFLVRKTIRGWLYNTQEYYIIRIFCRIGPYRSLPAAEYILKWAHWAEETVLR